MAEEGKTRTGRFIPCPAMLWRHPQERYAYEVWKSRKLKRGVMRTYYYFRCSACDPISQFFLNDWSDASGYTIPEAEAAGFRPKCSPERRAELLLELGLQQVNPNPPMHPAGPWPTMPPPGALPHHIQPIPRRPVKRGKPKKPKG